MGSMKGDLRDVDYDSSEDLEAEEEEQKDMSLPIDFSKKG